MWCSKCSVNTTLSHKLLWTNPACIPLFRALSDRVPDCPCSAVPPAGWLWGRCWTGWEQHQHVPRVCPRSSQPWRSCGLQRTTLCTSSHGSILTGGHSPSLAGTLSRCRHLLDKFGSYYYYLIINFIGHISNDFLLPASHFLSCTPGQRGTISDRHSQTEGYKIWQTLVIFFFFLLEWFREQSES